MKKNPNEKIHFFYSAKIEIFLERHFTADIWIIAIKIQLIFIKGKVSMPSMPSGRLIKLKELLKRPS